MEVIQPRCPPILRPPPPWCDPFINPEVLRMPHPPMIPYYPQPAHNQPHHLAHNHLHPMIRGPPHHPPQNYPPFQPRGGHVQPPPQFHEFRPPINPALISQPPQLHSKNKFHNEPRPHERHAAGHIKNGQNASKKNDVKVVSPSTALRERVGLSGYSRRLFVDKIPDDLICALCQDVVRKPLQTKCCGQVYCKVCVNRLPRIVKGMLGCPHCREKLEVFMDKRAENFVNNMKIFCVNSRQGCSWMGNVTNLKAHLDNCKLSKTLEQV